MAITETWKVVDYTPLRGGYFIRQDDEFEIRQVGAEYEFVMRLDSVGGELVGKLQWVVPDVRFLSSFLKGRFGYAVTGEVVQLPAGKTRLEGIFMRADDAEDPNGTYVTGGRP